MQTGSRQKDYKTDVNIYTLVASVCVFLVGITTEVDNGAAIKSTRGNFCLSSIKVVNVNFDGHNFPDR